MKLIQCTSGCPNGKHQEIMDRDLCSTWFQIGQCVDNTCDANVDGTQTRCSLTTNSAKYIDSSSAICSEDSKAPYPAHSTTTKLDAYKICSWCCNYCNQTLPPGISKNS